MKRKYLKANTTVFCNRCYLKWNGTDFEFIVEDFNGGFFFEGDEVKFTKTNKPYVEVEDEHT